MSKYFKNKISYNHVLLLSIIACYFLFLLCFYYVIRDQGTVANIDSSSDKYLIVMAVGVSSEDTGILDNYLSSRSDLISETTHIKSEEVKAHFNISSKLFSDTSININEIFADHYIVSINNEESEKTKVVLDSIKSIGGVSEVSIIKNDKTLRVTDASGSSQLSLTALIILMILTLALIYIGLSLDFQRNRDNLKSLIMKGATQKYLMSTYQKKGLLLSIKTWIGGLVLFFMSFYLLRFDSYSDLSIFDFKFLGIVCLVPLALIIFITSFVIYTKIMTLIRE